MAVIPPLPIGTGWVEKLAVNTVMNYMYPIAGHSNRLENGRWTSLINIDVQQNF